MKNKPASSFYTYGLLSLTVVLTSLTLVYSRVLRSGKLPARVELMTPNELSDWLGV